MQEVTSVQMYAFLLALLYVQQVTFYLNAHVSSKWNTHHMQIWFSLIQMYMYG